MALGLSLLLDPAKNPLSKRYHVRIVVMREDGRQLTDDDQTTIRASLAEAQLIAPPKAPAAPKKRRATAKKPAASGAAKPSPKRAAAKRPAR